MIRKPGNTTIGSMRERIIIKVPIIINLPGGGTKADGYTTLLNPKSNVEEKNIKIEKQGKFIFITAFQFTFRKSKLLNHLTDFSAMLLDYNNTTYILSSVKYYGEYIRVVTKEQ